MTNADKIRRMTDEELRDFIDHIAYECRIACAKDGISCNSTMCKDGILQWLTMEVGGE